MSDATDKAVQALASRVYDRDHAEPGDRDSTIDFAFEFVTWMRANGWEHRPPAARIGLTPVTPAPTAPTEVPYGLRGADIARHALAQQLSKGDTDGR
ncbi:hypothetical protein [Microbispora bryophytorum]|uniref:hypothetical protein n=1 Tax=Microbispora bryophytorum TaxID=1460882 RepID=UPI00340B4BD6